MLNLEKYLLQVCKYAVIMAKTVHSVLQVFQGKRRAHRSIILLQFYHIFWYGCTRLPFFRFSRLVTRSGEISVDKYFGVKYSLKLKYPTLPLIMERCQPKNNLYPIEVLIVCENQRVSKTQQTPSQVQTMIRVSVDFLSSA